MCSCFSYYDNDRKKYQVERYKGTEEAWVQSVRQCGSLYSSQPVKVNISYTVQVTTFCQERGVELFQQIVLVC